MLYKRSHKLLCGEFGKESILMLSCRKRGLSAWLSGRRDGAAHTTRPGRSGAAVQALNHGAPNKKEHLQQQWSCGSHHALHNCNYLDVQGQVPQSGAQLSKLSIIIAQRTQTQATISWFFSFLRGYHPDTLLSAPNHPSCHFPIVYPLMKIKMSGLGIINICTEVQHVFHNSVVLLPSFVSQFFICRQEERSSIILILGRQISFLFWKI